MSPHHEQALGEAVPQGHGCFNRLSSGIQKATSTVRGQAVEKTMAERTLLVGRGEKSDTQDMGLGTRGLEKGPTGRTGLGRGWKRLSTY